MERLIDKLIIKKEIRMNRESLTGAIILICLGVVLLTVIAVRLLDVSIENIEQVDHGLYTVVTDEGSVNVVPQDVLRIERTYTKAAVTGKPVELDKVYTDKGFIYVSSLDPFAGVAHQIINSVDFEGKPVWERANTNWKTVQPYAYVIGTPEKRIPWLFLTLSLQYLAFSIGGIALAVFIFPFRFDVNKDIKPSLPAGAGEQEYMNTEEKALGAVAK